jgi:cytochrome P450
MMRDPRIWGEDAELFKPERFLPEYNPKAGNLPDMGSLPFGFGIRYASCLPCTPSDA